MKRVFFVVYLMAFADLFSAKAQYVGLTGKEIKDLKQEITVCSSCLRAVQPLLSLAGEALKTDPSPIAKIRSEGLLMGDSLKMASLRAVEDATKVYALSMSYKLLDKEKYLDKALVFLKSWAVANQATGNPIDETKLEDMFYGYDLIRSEIKPEDRKAIDSWIRSIFNAELNSAYARPGRGTSVNNWNSHRIKILSLAAYTLHQESYYPVIEKLFMDQIERNLFPDGSGFDFNERDALHYHLYTLDPLIKSAIPIFRASGKNLFTYISPTGSSLQRSVDFLVPFATGVKQHIEFKNSRVRFDQERARNNEKGYQPSAFHRKSAIPVLSLAAFFDPKYKAVVEKLSEDAGTNLQLPLNRIIRNP